MNKTLLFIFTLFYGHSYCQESQKHIKLGLTLPVSDWGDISRVNITYGNASPGIMAGFQKNFKTDSLKNANLNWIYGANLNLATYSSDAKDDLDKSFNNETKSIYPNYIILNPFVGFEYFLKPQNGVKLFLSPNIGLSFLKTTKIEYSNNIYTYTVKHSLGYGVAYNLNFGIVSKNRTRLGLGYSGTSAHRIKRRYLDIFPGNEISGNWNTLRLKPTILSLFLLIKI